MQKEILVNAGTHERRIAVLENGRLEEFLCERPDQERLVGNIYAGIVQKVQPGMSAAFVDVGLEKAAFLPGDDFESSSLLDSDSSEGRGAGSGKRARRSGIGKQLRKGDRVLVQIVKEPIGSKGAKITMQLSFAGRFVVLLSGTNFVGVSKKTRNHSMRKDLKSWIREFKPEGAGVIVRTIGLDADEKTLKHEIELLHERYQKVLRAGKKARDTRLLHHDIGMTAGTMREMLTADVNRVVVDSKKDYKEIQSYLKEVDPALRKQVFLHKGKQAVFDVHGIEKEVDRILRRKVWLKSGGYLVFDHTEALVAIDVNTGRFTGKSDPEATIFKTNREAVQEIARQLRLRDIGGLIILDLIDMESGKHRNQIYREFVAAMQRDKAAHNIGRISEFGVIELTRKRERPELVQVMSEVCSVCGGTGIVFSPATVVARIDRCLRRNYASKGPKRIGLEVSPSLEAHLRASKSRLQKALANDNHTRVDLYVDDDYNNDEFRIYHAKTGEDLTDQLTE